MRIGEVSRRTGETEVFIRFNLDGTGEGRISTMVPFLDHMLNLFAVHGLFDLEVTAQGDIAVDDHHTVEDVGICLGRALAKALGSKAGIRRYGMSYVPMDETLARVVVDISNRTYLHYQVKTSDRKIGTFDTCLAKEFMRAFAQHGGLTLHVDLLHGENSHHIIEAVFKGLARAMSEAVTPLAALGGNVLSSKGCL
ncbi:MAG: imidazoleglycerol-phosphate dehydratase [Proteobacteria bacterium]|nr:MAG: imidazoleglycerol-phosphate dehydratase [Pseudomonadota bacterium]